MHQITAGKADTAHKINRRVKTAHLLARTVFPPQNTIKTIFTKTKYLTLLRQIL